MDCVVGGIAIHDVLIAVLFVCFQAVGKLLLNIATVGCEIGIAPLDYCALHYSVDLVRLISALMTSAEGSDLRSWRHLAAALSERSLVALDSANMHNDALVCNTAQAVATHCASSSVFAFWGMPKLRCLWLFPAANISALGALQVHEMAKEVENGRLMCLLVKLGIINERPGDGFSVSMTTKAQNCAVAGP